MRNLILCIGFLLPSLMWAQEANYPKKRFLLPPYLKEASGLHIPHPDSLWFHNDGGNAPLLYCLDPEGQLLDSIRVPGAENQDWEDLAVDDKGNLYIGDFGNNLSKREDLKFYKWDGKQDSAEIIHFRYPEQKAFPPGNPLNSFDMEACIWSQDSLYMFSKNLFLYGNFYSRLYRLPDEPGSYDAELLDSLYLKNRVVTAAAISPDGKRVALLSYHARKFLGKWVPAASVFLLSDFEGNDFFGGKVKKIGLFWKFGFGKQYEAIDFADDRTLVLACEAIGPSKAQTFVLKLKKKHVK